MTLYLDTSALLKLYVEEAESEACESFLHDDPGWFTGGHTLVEVRRNLARLLDDDDLVDARQQFEADWRRVNVMMMDDALCEEAARIAERTGTRSLDALHVAAALAVPSGTMTFFGAGEGEMTMVVPPPVVVTYDHRLAAAARQHDLDVAAPPG